MARPFDQRHRILLTLPDNWEDLMDRVKEIVAIQAAGRASAGLLSNPNLALLITGGVLAGLGAAVGADKAKDLVQYFQSVQTILTTDDPAEKSVAANQMIDFLKGILPFGFAIPKP